MTSPANNSRASVAAVVVACVRIERGSVSLIAVLSVSYNGSLRPLRRSSRTRSKMIMVSLSEYPSTVSNAATTVSDTSRCISLINASVVKMSWPVAIMAASPNRHSNRMARYTSVMTNESRIAIIAFLRSSLPTLALIASVRPTVTLFRPKVLYKTLSTCLETSSAPAD